MLSLCVCEVSVKLLYVKFVCVKLLYVSYCMLRYVKFVCVKLV